MHSVIGMLVIVAFAYAVSSNRAQVSWRTVFVAFAIQFAIGGIALFTSWGNKALSAATEPRVPYCFSRAGIDFMFGQLAAYDGPIGFVFAVNVLPVVVFFSAFIAVMYHLGIMMWIVRFLGGGLRSSRHQPQSRCRLLPIFLWGRPRHHWWLNPLYPQ